MKLALVGQPNCGKSTIFNAVAGYKTAVSNFPGTTIEIVRSAVSFELGRFELADLPGIYSLSSSSEEERCARQHLLTGGADVVIHVIDASMLGRSLELTLELLELGLPLVVALNMIDEAERKGVSIDAAHLERDLGVPVVPTVASRGQGLSALFRAALRAGRSKARGQAFPLSRDVESVVARLCAELDHSELGALGLPSRFAALELLEQDEQIEAELVAAAPGLVPLVQTLRAELEQGHGRPSDVVIASERHALSLNLFEHVAEVRTARRRPLGERVDRYVMHPLWGYLLLGLVLCGFFYFVFGVGRLVETPLLAQFDRLGRALPGRVLGSALLGTMLRGVVQGMSGGIGIVLPYLVPFLAGLAVLEDVGYIPRAAFLTDALLHRLGLHGKAIIPLVLGYGCTVPAIMGTRILENARDRYVTAVLVNFIPCAARTTIILAVVGFFLGPWPALGLYVLSLGVVAALGRVLQWVRPELCPGLVLEIPPYRRPSPKAVARKVWFRLREFVVLAWPILIAGSVALSLLEHFGLFAPLNWLLAPFTSGVLGLPAAAGISLVFGVLRKELTIVMLMQALGTSDFASVMSTGQMVVYTVFALLYVPCLATLSMLRVVQGTRGMLFVLGLSTAVATGVAVLFRAGFWLLGA